MNEAIILEHVTKRFNVISIPKHTTLKEAVVSFQIFGGKEKSRPIDAVNDVSFKVEKGTAFGVVGRNGSGKTTLLRLLAGIYTPTSGTVRSSGHVALLSLGLGFHPDMTGRENVMINGLILGLSRRQIEERFDEIVAFSELADFIDSPVRTYSSGMQMRLGFSVAVTVDPDVLLLDEVLAVGDEAFAAKCYARMRQFKEAGKTMVFVSHDTSQMLQWCDRAIWMDQGRIRMDGPTSAVTRAYHQAMVDAEASAGY